MVQVCGVQWYNVGVEMVRCTGSAQQCLSVWLALHVLILQRLLQPGYGEVAKRFFLWFSMFNFFFWWTCFWHFSSWYVQYVHFIFTSNCWEILNSESVCLEIWAPARSKPPYVEILLPCFFMRCFGEEKKGNQTTHGRIVAVSFILGPSGLQTYVCFPSQVLEIAICLSSCYSNLGPHS